VGFAISGTSATMPSTHATILRTNSGPVVSVVAHDSLPRRTQRASTHGSRGPTRILSNRLPLTCSVSTAMTLRRQRRPASNALAIPLATAMRCRYGANFPAQLVLIALRFCRHGCRRNGSSSPPTSLMRRPPRAPVGDTATACGLALRLIADCLPDFVVCGCSPVTLR
jgi:hypothetical protein